MKYSIPLRSRGTSMKYLMSLALVFAILALSPYMDALAQTGSEEGSTESAGRTSTESGTRSREDVGSPGTERDMRGRTTPPDTTDTESGTRSRGTTSDPGMTGTERGTRKPGYNGGTGTKGKSGSGNGSGTRSGTGSGTGTGGAPRSPE